MVSSPATATTLGLPASIIKSHLVQTAFEFLGTLLFLLLAFTAVQSILPPTSTTPPALSQLYISTSFAFSLYIAITVITPLAPASFNPAVNLALLITRRLPPILFFSFTIAQLLASIAASGLVIAILPAPLLISNHSLGSGISPLSAVILEAILTFSLCSVILRNGTPHAIAAMLGTGHMVTLAYSGAGLNPARSFGPSVIAGLWGHQWVWWVGPMIGGLVAGCVELALEKRRESEERGEVEDEERGERAEMKV